MFFNYKLLQNKTIKYYDVNDEVYYEDIKSSGGIYQFTPIEKIPDFIKDITVMLEDKRFYYHPGFDMISIIRAMYQNFSNGKVVSGGSGITQQLVRNQLHPEKRNVIYKIKELIKAISIEIKYSKEDILKAYLNSVFYGDNAYGIGAASKVFFNKIPNELTINEAIFLAGLPQSPSIYNPRKNMKKALERKNVVIKVLENNGFFEKYCVDKNSNNSVRDIAYIKKCKDEIFKSPIQLKRGEIKRLAPHFTELVMKELDIILGKNFELDGNYNIYTTLDTSLYEKSLEIMKKHIAENEDKNINNAAVVILNNQNYGVSTLIGSVDYFDEKIQGYVNNSVSLRQAGSTLKPFTYALAFEQGMSPNDIVNDSFLHLKTKNNFPYEPKNYDFKEYGEVTLRQALANSYNISAIRIAQKVGVKNLLDILKASGFDSLKKDADEYGVALTLGDGEIRLFDLVTAYSIFLNDGQKFKYHFINKIVKNNEIIFQRNQELSEKIFSKKSVLYVKDILSDNNARIQQFGEDSPLKTSKWSAVKTGTTRNFRDNWTVGFNRNSVLGVWVGNADASYLKKSTGVTGAAPIWHDIMEELFLIRKNNSFGSGYVQIDDNNTSIVTDNSIIISPQEGDEFLFEGTIQESLFFKAKKDIKWYLDNEFIGEGKKVFLNNIKAGGHCVVGKSIDNVNEKKCFFVRENNLIN